MAAGKEIHQKCVTGHKEAWEKKNNRGEQNMINQNIQTEFHCTNGSVFFFSKCNFLFGNKNIKHNTTSNTIFCNLKKLKEQTTVHRARIWVVGRFY